MCVKGLRVGMVHLRAIESNFIQVRVLSCFTRLTLAPRVEQLTKNISLHMSQSNSIYFLSFWMMDVHEKSYQYLKLVCTRKFRLILGDLRRNVAVGTISYQRKLHISRTDLWTLQNFLTITNKNFHSPGGANLLSVLSLLYYYNFTCRW